MKSFISTLILLWCLVTSTSALSRRAVRLFEDVGDLIDSGVRGQFVSKHGGSSDKSSTPAGGTSPGNDRIPMNTTFFPKAEIINETAKFFLDRGSQRTKIRYGPFLVDSMDKHEGMIDYLQIGAQMPCSDCTITFMQAGMEYPNGTVANADTSLWLHHIVLINLQRADTVCGTGYYGRGQRWFASGNERTPVSFSLDGNVPVGYHLAKGDSIVLETELMNQAMFPQMAVPTITFEWIPGKPLDFYESRPIWMDIGGCKIASDMPAKSNDVFAYSAPTYVSNFNGVYVGMGAHLHDGGMNLEIFQDLKYTLCNSVAHYGETPGYIDAPGTSMLMPMQPAFSPMKHISSLSYCYMPLPAGGTIKNGTLIDITANYNFTEHMPMLTGDGGFDDIMGIAVIYVAENMTQDTMISLAGNKTVPLATLPPLTGMDGMGMMQKASDDDDDGGDDDDSMAGMSGMSGMSMMSGDSAPTCQPMRDSPGTISLQNLNMTDESSMNTLLSAILCDTCLQAWSAPYARYFWYGIVVVIGLFGISRAMSWNALVSRKYEASKVRPDVYQMPAAVAYTSSKLARVIRTISYRQMTPTVVPSFFRLPPFGVVLMVVGYLSFLLALQFINSSTGDLQTDQFRSVRAGWLSVAQLPLIVLLSTKRNFVTMVTAVTYERLNILHRWSARGLLMTACMHFGFQWHGWVKAGVLKYELTDECVPTGAAAFALVLWMNLSTLAPFRNISYEFFVLQHLITFFGLIIAVAYHVPSTAPYARTYVYVSSALYIVAKLWQGVVFFFHQRRSGKASLVQVSPDITKITVSPSPFKDWRPGSFVRLSIPKLGLVQSHPATVASTPTSHSGDLVFYLLRRGGFTNRIAQAERQSATYSALVDGPYGGCQHDLAAYHTAVLVSGSTGVTYTISLLMDMATRAARVNLPIRRLVFIWSLYEGSLMEGLKDELASAVEMLRVAGIEVFVSIHVTGSYKTTSPFASIYQTPANEKATTITDSEAASDRTGSNDDIEKVQTRTAVARTASDHSGRSSANEGISVSAGRPDLDRVLMDARELCEGEMGVAVCGPLTMSQQVRNTVAGLQFGKSSNGAGTYLHVEGFCF